MTRQATVALGSSVSETVKPWRGAVSVEKDARLRVADDDYVKGSVHEWYTALPSAAPRRRISSEYVWFSFKE